MLKRILIGVSSSEYSRAAAKLAVGWAQWYEAEIAAVGVVDVPGLTAGEAVPLGGSAYKAERDQALVKAAQQQVGEELAAFQTRCAAAGVPCSTRQLEGEPAALLVREAQRADLLFVGKKHVPAEFGVAGTHVLAHVVRHAARPVVCVPAAANEHAAVLIAYDGSPEAARALQMFQAIGLASRRDLHLLAVSADAGQRYHAQCAVEYLQAHGHDAQVHVESSSAPAGSVIVAYARRLAAGLIVMGSCGQPRLKEIIFGSVTQTVLRDSNVPLFLYH
jgi:nucleotide-binding universal stress UspA family protein